MMPDSLGEDGTSLLVWITGIAMICTGAYLHLAIDEEFESENVKEKIPPLAAAICFWPGAAMIASYIIASWPGLIP